MSFFVHLLSIKKQMRWIGREFTYFVSNGKDPGECPKRQHFRFSEQGN